MQSNENQISLRPATPADVPLIVQLIEELADYERLRERCRADVQTLARHLFGSPPRAEVVLAECDGQPAAFALFFHTFSTFECAPSLYLEDLFVRIPYRRKGIGRAMIQHLAETALARGCKRLEWAVLEWNSPAIDFYVRIGARELSDWRIFRLDGEALDALAQGR